MSAPTFSRLIEKAPPEVRSFGARKNAFYSHERTLFELGPNLPLFRIDAVGVAEKLGVLVRIVDRGYIYETQRGGYEIFPGLPYFLEDAQFQGFLGRAFPTRHSDLRLPARLADWSSDQTTYAIARRGEDNTGSSAAGEQPKFTCILTEKTDPLKASELHSHRIVKFADETGWHDLLIAEWTALAVLAEAGYDASEAELVQGSKKTFLDSKRFDRVGMKGRRGILSFGALIHEFVGSTANWSQGAEALFREKRIDAKTPRNILFLDAFGILIDNTDRHFGNLSFHHWLESEKILAQARTRSPHLE